VTIAVFEAKGGTVDAQALTCFKRLRDFLDGMGQRFAGADSLVVEVTDKHNFAAVTEARRRVFGSQKPPVVSRRLTRLPPGEHLRITVHTDGKELN
jgi:hypothetical protein